MIADPRIQKLVTLKTIAEMLNQSGGLTPELLSGVLEKLLALSGLTSGWILFIEEKEFECASDFALPPALMAFDKAPMRCGSCWCVDRFRDGRLNRAVNILNCKRIEDAQENDWGDTQGITHHATVPLRSGDRKYGVLNVASPGKLHFNDEELALLEGVAYQIGGAIERMRLYAAEQQRAELFAKLGVFSRALSAAIAAGRGEDGRDPSCDLSESASGGEPAEDAAKLSSASVAPAEDGGATGAANAPECAAMEALNLAAPSATSASGAGRLIETATAPADEDVEDLPCRLYRQATALIGEHFEWPFAALLTTEGQTLAVRTVYANGRIAYADATIPLAAAPWLREAAQGRTHSVKPAEDAAALAALPELGDVLPGLHYLLAAPIPSGSARDAGLLLVGDKRGRKPDCAQGEVVEALGEHLAVVFEGAALEYNRRELARLTERNRLARDLHDSVSQMLFSLSMTAKGVESLLGREATAEALDSVRDMQSLAQHALREMRALIMQLRPAGLEAGLATALAAYGAKLGLVIATQVTGLSTLPRAAEEALWRIGQEALNNVRKHAGRAEADVHLQLLPDRAVLRVSDRGDGIAPGGAKDGSLGLSTMRERAQALGGRLTISPAPGGGTAVEATVPLRQ
ncbi:GAF domain-containing sensor histidine kinase [Paenibacillus methanolicus]|uniref:histidine kinase n=1 Tax=Paenibacillus methanolicus TaxID=582686 RepID=A0A5S5C8B8_9BACL|nr:GAF domain-containing sensor histidine kinase [Paenibacillus methanolicus]TYP75557.1 histidine kinase/DNA gyrase B/HSP90-like ATPase [Paenibacillus methanolicus]